MNIACPQDKARFDLAAIEGLLDLLRDGFENPEGLSGLVRVSVPEYPEWGFVVRYGPTLEVARDGHDRVPDSDVTLPIDTVHRLLAECETVDWRDASLIGTVTFSGNLALANHLARCCLRPSALTMARFRKAARQHAALGYRHLTQIETLNRPTQRQILEAMAESRPVIVTGLEPEPPCRDWTLDLLAERFGNSVVRVRSARHRQTMADFVQELKAFETKPEARSVSDFDKPYTNGATLPEAMEADFGPLFFGREDFIPPQLWLGSVPTHLPTTSLHRDPLTGFLFQVMGRKRLDLYSADQADLLYPMKAFNLYQPCWFRPESPDYDSYPLSREAKCISVTLNPGDLIIQPAGWFHQVHALESPNMSVSYFWRY